MPDFEKEWLCSKSSGWVEGSDVIVADFGKAMFKKALVEWGQHKENCYINYDYAGMSGEPPGKCDCGFEKVMSDLK